MQQVSQKFKIVVLKLGDYRNFYYVNVPHSRPELENETG
jgi:hypothetical protein